MTGVSQEALLWCYAFHSQWCQRGDHVSVSPVWWIRWWGSFDCRHSPTSLIAHLPARWQVNSTKEQPESTAELFPQSILTHHNFLTEDSYATFLIFSDQWIGWSTLTFILNTLYLIEGEWRGEDVNIDKKVTRSGSHTALPLLNSLAFLPVTLQGSQSIWARRWSNQVPWIKDSFV